VSQEDPDGGGTTQRLPSLQKAAPPGGPVPAGDGPEGPAGATDSEGPGLRARRFWAVRRLPAGLLALLGLSGTGLLLYDVASVRAGRRAMSWRRTVAEELATRPLDDVWVRAGAAVVAALGLWLVLLALTPGLRGVLPMRRADAQVRAGLDRKAAALVLRDRAVEVSGVRSARVKVARRRVKVRAEAHFRELEDVRADLDAALRDGVLRLGLARRPRLSLHVRRQPRK
jgi:hypothetical protein